ncbi:SDR family oxidoreductase [Chitinophaga arvensicola]|uniref:NADP-dependent 3-hydroxy acid dehydrogenase YdfG n=1 Tax=Chitinophaga arvensicola TaxID=29529 RepID=A0A1I0S4S5_9BACT|nr:SDR family oxidoreductase [Chitinophaga arvensicola]SEW49620.1 NADP-dependent 3-hydroxy acid dehydrogenase YdfG [Chitinophaga arvensicola]
MKQTIFITGASSGIGLATAQYFVEQGWNVVATMRQPYKQTALKNSDQLLLLKLDVAEPATFPEIIDTAIARFGKIDVLLNNAGYGQHGLFEATTTEQIRRQFDVNLFGTMDITKALLPHFRQQRSGSIITITSGVGRVTVPLVSVYAASKFALEGFCESLSFELAAQHIKVKIIEPGSINTNFEQTTKANFAVDDTLTDYSEYLKQMDEIFKSIYSGGSASPRDVAAAVFAAATDGSDQLRYVVGEDLQPLLDIRNGGTDEQYMNVLRSTFSPSGNH